MVSVESSGEAPHSDNNPLPSEVAWVASIIFSSPHSKPTSKESAHATLTSCLNHSTQLNFCLYQHDSLFEA